MREIGRKGERDKEGGRERDMEGIEIEIGNRKRERRKAKREKGRKGLQQV